MKTTMVTVVLVLALSMVGGAPATEILLERTGSWDIPDEGLLYDYWDVSSAPSGALVTSVEYEFLVDDRDDEDDFWCSDYEIYLSSTWHGGQTEYHCVWDNEGEDTDDWADDDTADDSDIDLERSTDAFDGESPNQRWYILVKDNVTNHVLFWYDGLGRLRHEKLVIHYQIPVPRVVDMPKTSAYTAIATAGLVVGTESSQCSNSVPVDEVISQSPANGTMVDAGSAVNLVISSGPCQVQVPNVTGMDQGAAHATITSAGLVVGTEPSQSSNAVPANRVISQSPTGGAWVSPGSAVNLVISSGPCPVSVPNVVGMAKAAAESAILSVGLAVGTESSQCSDMVPADQVISQSPTGGTSVPAGSAVNLTISSGSCGGPQVIVPNVVGMATGAAESAILSAGLAVGTKWYTASDTVPAEHVIGQDPAAGTAVSPGSAVVLTISTGPSEPGQVQVPDVVGMTQSAAESAIDAAGLVVGTVDQASSSTVPKGNVISQSPAAGTSMASGSAVDLVVSSGPPDDIADPNLLAWWKLDETSGDIVYDSAAQNDGVAYGWPSWQPGGGKVDGALRLDGFNDYAQLPIGPLISSLTDSTFATWVNWSGVGGDWQRIFDFGSGINVNMFLTPRTGGTGSMRFAITNAGADNEDQATAPQALAAGWHHVAVTMDAASKTHSLYLDGQVVATKTAARYTPSSLSNTTQNWLARSQYEADAYFNGSLDDFRIYNRVLNAAAINQLVSPQPAAMFEDDFQTQHDYLTNGLGDYDGLLNGTIRVLNADSSRNGCLYMETANASWEPGPGPLLYVNVTGDFTAAVKVTDFAGTLQNRVLDNAGGIIARAAAAEAGPGEDWVCVAYFPTWTGHVGWSADNGFRVEFGFTGRQWEGDDTYAIAAAEPYLRLRRVGRTFYFEIGNGTTWRALPGEEAGRVRTDLPATLQVGLFNATYSAETGYIAFDDFRIQQQQ